jgi:hypothetical protein
MATQALLFHYAFHVVPRLWVKYSTTLNTSHVLQRQVLSLTGSLCYILLEAGVKNLSTSASQSYKRTNYRLRTMRFTYSSEQSTTSETNRFSDSYETPCILWNPKVHYPTHKSPPPVPILRHTDPVHTPTSHFFKIHLNIILSSMPGSSKWPLSPRFPHQNPEYTSLTHTRYMPRPSHSSQVESVLQNNIFEGVTTHKGSAGHILCACLSLKVLYSNMTRVKIRSEVCSYAIINTLPS